eukprot:417357_1
MSPSDESYNIMVDFKYILNIQKRCFQVGFIFYYWKYYEYEGIESDNYFSQNDHSGYKPHQLFVRKKYQNVHDEMLNNQISERSRISSQHFKSAVYKATAKMQSRKARQLRSTSV